MSAFLAFVRFRRGVVGETQRSVHLVPFPQPGAAPDAALVDTPVDTVSALCGQSFHPGEAEQLNEPRGMPCEHCLAQATRNGVRGRGPSEPTVPADPPPRVIPVPRDRIEWR